jgi:type II secretory pathway predicted ATPase ExeA
MLIHELEWYMQYFHLLQNPKSNVYKTSIKYDSNAHGYAFILNFFKDNIKRVLKGYIIKEYRIPDSTKRI